METNATPIESTAAVDAVAAEEAVEVDPREALESRFRSGASWFYWVAALSLLNSVVALFNGEWGFAFGLGFTQLVDAVAAAAIADAPDMAVAGRLVSFGVNLVILSVVALMGWLAHKRKSWVFVVGLVIYLFDAMLFLLVGDFLGLAFHGWVFVAVISGLFACRKLKALEAPAAVVGEAFSPA